MWKSIASWPVAERHRVVPGVPFEIRGIRFEAFALDHSVNAPAVGYRIAADGRSVFYAPDVLRIRHMTAALRNVDLYIGDGATIDRPIVRIERRRHVAVGHASVAAQLDWCARVGVRCANFTHCGRAIVAAPAGIEERIAQFGRARHVEAAVAEDGLRLRL